MLYPFLSGFCGLILQTMLTRELLINFIGNELTISIILGNWVMSNSLGSIISGYILEKRDINADKVLNFGFIILGICFPIMIVFSRAIKPLFGFLPGAIPNIFGVYLLSLVVLIFVSFCFGAIYSTCVNLLSKKIKKAEKTAGIVYCIESLGALVGGIVFTFLLTKQNSLLIAFLSSILIFASIRKYILLIAAFISLTLLYKPLNEFSLGKQWRTEKIEYYKNTKYGNITVVRKDSQYTFFFSGSPIITMPIGDISYIEDFIHFPMLCHERPKKVILVSGGFNFIDEILKHDVETLKYVELDPYVIKAVQKFFKREYKNVDFIYTDANFYINGLKEKYDVILLNFTAPLTLETNRFYTNEFFKVVKRIMDKNGIMCIAVTGNLTYLHPELRSLNSVTYYTLSNNFKHVFVIPGDGYNLFICSDNEINYGKIAEEFEKRNLETNLFSKQYIYYRTSKYWKDWYFNSIEGGMKKLNKNHNPIALFYSIANWNVSLLPYLGKFFRLLEKVSVWHLMAIIASFFIFNFVIFKRQRTAYWIVTTTGFTSMSLSIILILLFQVYRGNLYEMLALLVGAFMFGLAMGSFTANNFFVHKRLNIYLLATEIFIILSTCAIMLTKFLQHEIYFYFLSLVYGILTGMEFPILNAYRLLKQKRITETAGVLYGLDLIGSYMGALLSAFFILPVLGLPNLILIIVVMKLFSVVLISLPPPST